MYDKCYFCLDQLPKLKKESTASFFVNFGGAGVQKSRPTLLYLPKPLCVLVEGTALCRNSCLELSRMSWSPAMMETPSLHSLVIRSEGVEVTVMEKETSCALWYSTLCRHIAFVFTFLLQSLAWSSPLV